MEYYLETLFDAEYFPAWEFTIICIIYLTCSIILRLARIEKKMDKGEIKWD